MALQPVDLELSVERELAPAPGGAPRRARLTRRFLVDPKGVAPTEEEIGRAIAALDAELDRSLSFLPPGSVPVARADRGADELVESYRPRQVELVDLLEAEGEVSAGEARLLREHLSRAPPPATAPSAPAVSVAARERPHEPPMTDRPIAAAPLAGDRTPTSPRPVPELLERYRIESLKQAGAVRARRQISFEEYMALKRHFSADAPPAE